MTTQKEVPMTTTKAPKTTNKKVNKTDAADAFVGDEVAGRTITYKTTPYYYYGYRGGEQNIYLGVDNKTIRGQFNDEITLKELGEFLAWLKANAAWHKTTVRYGQPKQTTLAGTFDLPSPDVTQASVESTFHRNMTKEFTADLARIAELKAVRAAKHRAVTAARNKKRRAELALTKKKAKEREERDERLLAAADFSDLAQALKVLKKHGLKIVTIDDEGRAKA